MFVLLNGSFGIGKTTVAAALVTRLEDAAIYDPERVGYVLRRTPAWLLGRAQQPSDYQDLPLWRTLIARGARHSHRRVTTVIVPMAFTNLLYFESLATSLARDGEVLRFCLVAPLELVLERLARRAASEQRLLTEFEARRSAECVRAHRDPAYGCRLMPQQLYPKSWTPSVIASTP